MMESVVPEFTDLELINEIATYPCLYHHLDRDYKNVEKIEECWKRIGAKLNYPGNYIIYLLSSFLNPRRHYDRFCS